MPCPRRYRRRKDAARSPDCPMAALDGLEPEEYLRQIERIAGCPVMRVADPPRCRPASETRRSDNIGLSGNQSGHASKNSGGESRTHCLRDGVGVVLDQGIDKAGRRPLGAAYQAPDQAPVGGVEFGDAGISALQRFQDDESYRAARRGELIVDRLLSKKRNRSWMAYIN